LKPPLFNPNLAPAHAQATPTRIARLEAAKTKSISQKPFLLLSLRFAYAGSVRLFQSKFCRRCVKA
jgi:hypothetical protein